jgi:phage terminase large subunit
VSEIILPYMFEPRDYQLPLWEAFDSGIKRFLLVWHRRAGKDKCCLNLMARATQERVGTYYYFLPTYSQGKKIIWDGMDFEGYRFLHHFPKELIESMNQTEMKIRMTNGSLFQIIGSDNIDSIVGTNPVGVVFSEYSLQDPQAWDFIRPILSENRGWALFNGTPRGRVNHLHKLYEAVRNNPDWFVNVSGIDVTHALTEEQVQQERESGMDEELIQQEFYCSFEAGMSGAYYYAQMNKMYEEGRITRVPYDPILPVDTWWDIGIGDSTSIIFTQTVRGAREIRIIDYYETSGESLHFFAKLLDEMEYVYGEHIAPHDIEVREMGTGKSRLEIARTLGLNFKVARRLPLDDGIHAVRMMLPLVWIDEKKCARLIDALLNYRKVYDLKMLEYKSRPLHDWSSHPADAMRAGAVGRRNPTLPRREQRYETKFWKGRQRGERGWMSM